MLLVVNLKVMVIYECGSHKGHFAKSFTPFGLMVRKLGLNGIGI